MNSDISMLLETNNKLLALLVTKDLNSTESISTLAKAGLQPKDIAECLGTTANSVRVTLSQLRSGKLKIKSKVIRKGK